MTPIQEVILQVALWPVLTVSRAGWS